MGELGRWLKFRVLINADTVHVEGWNELVGFSVLAQILTQSQLFARKKPLAKHGESCPFVRFQAAPNQPFFLRDGLVHLNK